MSKMIAGILFIWIVLTVFASFINGSGGINATYLTQPMGVADTQATVSNTAGFLVGGDTLVIGGESMTYTSCDYTHFYGLNRPGGIVHAANTMVYNQQTSLINDALGFNVNAVTTSSGLVSIFTIPLKFFTVTLGNVISGSSVLPFLPGMWAFVGYFWLVFTSGIVISFGVSMVWILSGIVGKLT